MPMEKVCDFNCRIGENPLWHPTEKRLYWCDIPTGRLFRFDPNTGAAEEFQLGEIVGGFTIQADGSLLLFMSAGAVKVWRNGTLTTVIQEIPDERETRFNDVIADPAGRVFCGTMPTNQRLGRLYRLDPSLKLTIVLDGVTCPNGLGFTLDRRRLYFTDSRVHTIYLFDYDEKSGNITNQRVFIRTPEAQGLPDGMTVDSEGYVWSALWDGNAVVRYSPDGKVDQRIDVPAHKSSSVTFGGDDLTDLYVTSAGAENKAVEGPDAGALFRFKAGVRGVPEFYSRIGL